MLDHSPYTLAARLVHLVLAERANEDRDYELWYSISTVAAKAKLSRRSVEVALAKMVEDGFLELLESVKGQPTRYRFLMPLSTCAESAYVNDDANLRNPRNLTVTNPKKIRRVASARTRIPDQFFLNADDRKWAVEHVPLVDLHAATEEFVTYWRGDGRPKADWKQTWRNSMLKAAAQHAPRRNVPLVESRPTITRRSGIENSIAGLEFSDDPRDHAEAQRLRAELDESVPSG